MFVVLAALAAARTAFWSYGADAGTFAQIVLDAFGGMRNGVEHGTHYRFHWSPALALLWPAMALTHSVLTLQLIQAAACVATAPLLAALVRPYLGGALASRVGLLALLYPPLLGVAFTEFHEVGLFPPLAVGLVLAADRRRWGWYALCALLIAGLREDLGLELAIAGAVFVLAGTPAGRSRALASAGLATTLGALAVLAVYYGIVTPQLGGWRPAHFYRYPFPATPLAVATLGRLTYLLEAFVPLALLPLRSRWGWLALPGLAIVLLANEPLVWRMGNHYAALWIPWLLVGAAFGLATVARRDPRLAARWANVALGICALVLIAFDPLHPLHFLKPTYHDLASARRAFACVPPGATVSSYDEWYTAVAAQRADATIGAPDGVDDIVQADDVGNADYRARVFPHVRAEVDAGRYRTVCTFGAVHDYRRTDRIGVRSTP